MFGPRVNGQIRISPVRVIDQDNRQVGIVETPRAMQMAREAGLDLVEVDPNAKPPVCRIIDYGKMKYDKSKQERQARHKSHKQELKGIRLRPRIDKHDLEHKIKHAREFLEEADKVQFTMRFRGMREMHHTDLGMEVMRAIAEQLSGLSKVEMPARREGRRITMMLAPLPEVQRRVAAERKAREKERERQRQAPEAEAQRRQPAVETLEAEGGEE